MTPKDAIEADRLGDNENAAKIYEAQIASTPAAWGAVVNLAIVYWQAMDPGTAAPLEFKLYAGRRLWEILEDPRNIAASDPSFVFWKRYINWAELGKSLEVSECRGMLTEFPDYLEPAMHAFAQTGGSECAAEANKLLDACRANPTARSRYVGSVIEATIKYSLGSARRGVP